MRFETSVVLFALGALTSATALEDNSELSHTTARPILYPEFLQSQVDHGICSYSVRRVRDSTENPDPNEAIKQSSKSDPYTDGSFTFNNGFAFYWVQMPIKDQRDSLVNDAQNSWARRITEQFGSDYSMWGSNGIELVDPNQGQLGDCWIVAAASCVAQTPSRIRKLFVTDDLNENGVYTVQLYSMGIPVTVTVDDYLPFMWENNAYKLRYAAASEDKALWMPILEKAAAKLYGNYEQLIGGNLGPAIQTLTGAPFFDKKHKDVSVDELWSWISQKMNDGWILSAGTPQGSQGTDQQTNSIGVAYMHAYTMLGINTLSNGQRLVKIRNPWGREKFFGDWSDKSNQWSYQLKQEVDYVDQDDGIWYISIEDFHWSFSDTTANANIDSYHHAHYAAFGVDTPKYSDDPGADENLHKEDITISSDKDQMVYISAYTYDSQHIRNGDCWSDEALKAKQLWFTHDHQTAWQGMKWTNYAHSEGVQMKAGDSFNIKFQAYWPPEDYSPHDYSIVAWSEVEPVKLVSTHNHSYTDFPHYTIKPDTVIRGPAGTIVNGGGANVPCTGSQCVHSGYLGTGGDQFKVDMKVTGSNSMRFDMSLLEAGKNYETRFDLTYNDHEDVKMTGYCGDETFTWSKTGWNEIKAETWKKCVSGGYWLQFKTNIEEERWEGWFNDGYMQLTFEPFSYGDQTASNYQAAWNLSDKTIHGRWNIDQANTVKWDWSDSLFTANPTLALKSETTSEPETTKKHVSTGVMAGVSVAAASLFACVFMAKRKNVVADDFERV